MFKHTLQITCTAAGLIAALTASASDDNSATDLEIWQDVSTVAQALPCILGDLPVEEVIISRDFYDEDGDTFGLSNLWIIPIDPNPTCDTTPDLDSSFSLDCHYTDSTLECVLFAIQRHPSTNRDSTLDASPKPFRVEIGGVSVAHLPGEADLESAFADCEAIWSVDLPNTVGGWQCQNSLEKHE